MEAYSPTKTVVPYSLYDVMVSVADWSKETYYGAEYD